MAEAKVEFKVVDDQKIIKTIQDIITQADILKNVFDSVAKSSASMFKNISASIDVSKFDQMAASIEKIEASLSGLGGAANGPDKGLKGIWESFKEGIIAARTMQKTLSGTGKELGYLHEESTLLEQAMGSLAKEGLAANSSQLQKLKAAYDSAQKKIESFVETKRKERNVITEIIMAHISEIEYIEKVYEAFGGAKKSYQEAAELARAYEKAIRQLIAKGLSPQSKQIKELVKEYDGLNKKAEKLKNLDNVWKSFGDGMKQARGMQRVLAGTGKELDYMKQESSILQKTMEQLIKAGFSPASNQIKRLQVMYTSINNTIAKHIQMRKDEKNVIAEIKIQHASEVEYLKKVYSAFGRAKKGYEETAALAKVYERTIKQLIAQGIDPQSDIPMGAGSFNSAGLVGTFHASFPLV